MPLELRSKPSLGALFNVVDPKHPEKHLSHYHGGKLPELAAAWESSLGQAAGSSRAPVQSVSERTRSFVREAVEDYRQGRLDPPSDGTMARWRRNRSVANPPGGGSSSARASAQGVGGFSGAGRTLSGHIIPARSVAPVAAPIMTPTPPAASTPAVDNTVRRQIREMTQEIVTRLVENPGIERSSFIAEINRNAISNPSFRMQDRLDNYSGTNLVAYGSFYAAYAGPMTMAVKSIWNVIQNDLDSFSEFTSSLDFRDMDRSQALLDNKENQAHEYCDNVSYEGIKEWIDEHSNNQNLLTSMRNGINNITLTQVENIKNSAMHDVSLSASIMVRPAKEAYLNHITTCVQIKRERLFEESQEENDRIRRDMMNDNRWY